VSKKKLRRILGRDYIKDDILGGKEADENEQNEKKKKGVKQFETGCSRLSWRSMFGSFKKRFILGGTIL